MKSLPRSGRTMSSDGTPDSVSSFDLSSSYGTPPCRSGLISRSEGTNRKVFTLGRQMSLPHPPSQHQFLQQMNGGSDHSMSKPMPMTKLPMRSDVERVVRSGSTSSNSLGSTTVSPPIPGDLISRRRSGGVVAHMSTESSSFEDEAHSRRRMGGIIGQMSIDSSSYDDEIFKPRSLLENIAESMETPPVAVVSDSQFQCCAGEDGIDLSHEDAPWYHGDLLREEAKILFSHHGAYDGMFLVRDSSKLPGHFVLSLMNSGHMQNFQIQHVFEDRVSYYKLSSGARYTSIAGILAGCLRNPQCLPCPLTYYIARPVKQPDMHCIGT